MGIKDTKRFLIFIGIISFIVINLYISFFEYNVNHIYQISIIPFLIIIFFVFLFSNKKFVNAYINYIFQNKNYLQRYFNPYSNAYIILSPDKKVISYNDKFTHVLEKLSNGVYYKLTHLNDLNLDEELLSQIESNLNVVYETKNKFKFEYQKKREYATYWFAISIIPFIFDENNIYISIVVKDITEEIDTKNLAKKTVEINNLISSLILQINKATSYKEVYERLKYELSNTDVFENLLIFTTNDLIYYNLISYFNKNSFCDKVINKYFIDKPVIIHKDNILIEKVNIVENIINLFPFIQEIDLNELANLNQHASYITYCFEVENEYYLFVLCTDLKTNIYDSLLILFNAIHSKFIEIELKNKLLSLDIINNNIFDNFDIPVIKIDNEFNILYCNNLSQTILSLNSSEKLDKFLVKKDQELLKSKFNEDNFYENIEVEIVTAQKGAYPVNLMILPVHNNPIAKRFYLLLIPLNEKFEMKNEILKLSFEVNTIFNNINEFAVILDENGIVKKVNKIANQKLTQILKDKIAVGDKINKIIPNENLQDFILNFNKALKGEVIEYTKKITFSENLHLYLKLKYIPILNDKNIIKEVLFIIDDTTNYYELETLKNDYVFKNKFDVKNIPDPIVILDPLGNIIFANPQFINEFGFEEKELIGQNISLVADKSFIIKIKKIFTSVSKKELIVETLQFANGTKTKYEINAKLLEHGRIICTLRKVSSDIYSEEKSILSKLFDSLVNEISNPIVIIDSLYNIIFSNNLFEKQFKAGNTLNTFKNLLNDENQINILNNIISSKTTNVEEIVLKIKDDYKVEVIPYYDAVNAKYYYILVFNKYTTTKEIISSYQHLEKSYNHILDIAGDAFIILNDKFDTIYLSDNLYKTFLSQDYKKSINSINDIFGKILTKQIIEVCKNLNTIENTTLDIQFEKKNEEPKYYRIYIGTYNIDNNKRYYCFFENRTEIYKLTEKLKQYEKLLQHDNFNYEIVLPKLSHNLRNFINSSYGLIELLNIPNFINKENIDKYTQKIITNGDKLLRTFDKLNDFQLIENKKIKFTDQAYSIIDIFENLKYELKDTLINSDKKIIIELVNNTIEIKIFQDIVTRIIKYLLFNEMLVDRFNDYFISTSIILKDKPNIEFKLYAEPIDEFTEFLKEVMQFDIQQTENFEHYAFDLYIAGKILEEYSSKLVIKDENNHKYISFLLPIDSYKKNAEKLLLKIDSNSFENIVIKTDKKNIVIYEKDELNLKILEELLYNHNIKVINSYDEFEKVFDDFYMDIAILKIEENEEFLNKIKTIKNNSKFKTVKIIGLSGNIQIRKEDLYKIGFDYIMIKPINKYELIKIISEV